MSWAGAAMLMIDHCILARGQRRAGRGNVSGRHDRTWFSGGSPGSHNRLVRSHNSSNGSHDRTWLGGGSPGCHDRLVRSCLERNR